MKISTLFQELHFVGQAEGDRRTYYAFQGDGPYIIASPNDRGGLNVNVIDHEAPDVVTRRFKGQRVTSSILVKQGRRADLFGAASAALNALYLMVAWACAKVEKARWSSPYIQD
jgi:hypothetical protein